MGTLTSHTEFMTIFIQLETHILILPLTNYGELFEIMNKSILQNSHTHLHVLTKKI